MANTACRKQASLRIDPADGYSTAMCGRYSITTPVEGLARASALWSEL